MGRPRTHDERTADALLEAAERTVHDVGLGGLSVRGLAAEVGTTTRAVYSLFGSKDGLLVALGARAFQLLGTALDALPTTDDAAADLVEAGVAVFRQFATQHPTLFHIGIQHALPASLVGEFRAAAAEAFVGLEGKVRLVADAGLLGGRPIRDVAVEFHAVCEGLAAIELRGVMPPGKELWIWRDALTALVTGMSTPVGRPVRR